MKMIILCSWRNTFMTKVSVVKRFEPKTPTQSESDQPLWHTTYNSWSGVLNTT
jgi:hypothetical protein